MAIQNIALLAQTPEFDPLVPAQRQAQIQALADQQQQRQLALQQARQNADEYAGVRSVYAANPTDANARLTGLAAVSPRAYAAEQKQQTETAKAAAETRAKQIETSKQKMELMGQTFNFVAQNPTLENALGAIQHMQANGVFTPEEAAQYTKQVQDNPADIPRLAGQAFASATKASDQLLKYEKTNLGGTTVGQTFNPVSGRVQTVNTMTNTQSPESVATNETARRGQNMTSATAAADRASREKIANAGQYDTERGIVVNKRTGQSVQVTDAQGNPIGGGGKPMTEFQGKSAGYADRALEADNTLNSLKYDPAAINSKASVEGVPLIGGALGAATNAMLSSENQRAEQAQRNFINAILRQESGAAIGAAEFENARKQYFPQPGDSAEVIAQKAANRKTAIAGLQRSAGPSYKAPAAAAAQVPNKNAKGWILHTDAQGNRAYVSPDGSQYEEVK